MLSDPEPSAPVREKSVRIRQTLTVVLWTLAIGVSTTGWLVALGYTAYLLIKWAVT
jgi:hypothetical protein